MKSKIVLIIIKYLIAALAATGILIMALLLRDYFNTEDLKLKIRYLADGFFIPGALYVLFGVFVWLVNEGTFTGLGYMFKHVLQTLIPMMKKDTETYAMYREKRRKIKGYYFLYFVGLPFLVTGIIITILFYTI